MCEELVCVFFVCSLWLQHFELVSQALVLAINNGSGIGDPMHLMIIRRTSTIGYLGNGTWGVTSYYDVSYYNVDKVHYSTPKFFLEGQVLTGFCL